MKANELMIGDLVIFEDNIHKITDLSLCIDGSILVHVNVHDVQIFEHEISPIPLTEEILKANKIHCRPPKNGETFDKEWVIPNGAFYIRQDGHEFWVFEDQVSIRYVHQLQHALRLCGINELADNFKIQE